MIAFLRNLAERWADAVLVKAVDDLRRKLIRVEAAEKRLKQELDAANFANRNLSRYNEELARLLNQALDAYDLATARARQTELEQAAVAATGKGAGGGAWDDVTAAGLDTPETRQP